MPTLLIETRVTGPADRDDRDTMVDVITKENERRAALTPPGTPLLFSTVVEQRASYAEVMSVVANDIHRHNISQAFTATLQDIRERWPNATDQQRAAALAALA